MYHGVWHILRSVILIAASVYLGFSAIVYFLQARFVFAPSGMLDDNPGTMGLDYEDVFLRTPDNVMITGWYVPAENERYCLLFCHGNAGNISGRLDTVSLYNRLGLSVLVFDYRGYGASEGRPTEQGTYLDAETAWKWLIETKGYTPEKIIVMGRSLGGPIAAWLTKTHNPRAAIIESTFTSITDMGTLMYPWLPARLLTRYRYPTLEYVAEIQRPVLVVHSSEDTFVPYKMGQSVFQAANEPKMFLSIKGPHSRGFLESGDTYINGVETFLASLDGDG